MSYRLHIDIPLGMDQTKAIVAAKMLMSYLSHSIEASTNEGVVNDVIEKEFGYRLGEDTDRANKNYLKINENGHAANGKSRCRVGEIFTGV